MFILSFVSAQEVTEEQRDTPLWSADVIPLCDFGACLEGSQEVWQVTVNNLGQTQFDLQGLSLSDSQGLPFALLDLTTQNSIIPVGQSATVNIPLIIPPPSRSSTLYYKINYIVSDNIFPDNTFRRMSITPLSDLECMNNDFCDGSDVCLAYKCIPYSMFNSSVVPKPKQGISADGVQTILIGVVIVLLLLMLSMSVKHPHKKK